jgi:hypothetical protein
VGPGSRCEAQVELPTVRDSEQAAGRAKVGLSCGKGTAPVRGCVLSGAASSSWRRTAEGLAQGSTEQAISSWRRSAQSNRR